MTREEKNYFNILLKEEPDFRNPDDCAAYEKKLQKAFDAYMYSYYVQLGEGIKRFDEKLEKLNKDLEEFRK